MPLRELSIVFQRGEFVSLARRRPGEGGDGVRALCRRFGISPTTGYKRSRRHAEAGAAGLVDRPRRPRRSPGRTPAALEEAVLALRAARIRPGAAASCAAPPARSRPRAGGGAGREHDHRDPAPPRPARPDRERATPDDLRQMDFKGHSAHEAGGRCHPLGLIGDHSRFPPRPEAGADEREATVRAVLVQVFRRSGLPHGLLMDRGPPRGPASAVPRPFAALTASG